MSESPRSAVDRIFNMKESDFVDDSADVAEDISSKHLIFSKLLNAANGYITLCPEDADQIISVICKTMNCGGTSRPREETTATLVDLLGSTADSCDNALLTYLTTNYTRLEHQNDEEGTESTHTTPHGSATKRRTSEVRPKLMTFISHYNFHFPYFTTTHRCLHLWVRFCNPYAENWSNCLMDYMSGILIFSL